MSKTNFLNSLFSLYKQEVKPNTILNVLEKDFARPQTLIVFSHLRYEFVKQRPQHLVERMAQDMNVIFVEEPIGYESDEEGTARTFSPYPRVTVIQPKTRFADFESIKEVLYSFTSLSENEKPILWFYSPSFVPMTSLVSHSMVIYDCMDELAQFKGAPPQLVQDEQQLISLADLVFTGGRSLYESKKRRHDSVHCFPSSVERKHFEKALQKSTPVPTELKELSGPVVGFYGVIDERLDLELLDKTAELLPAVNFVIIGPVVKINEADLPKRANIHYLGGRKYEELPAYLKGFDIAFMPFAINQATQFISPTKTLEFMAAQKPIISTAIRDVAEIYKKEVKIARSAEEMAEAITAYLAESTDERKARIKLEKAVMSKTSWDKTAQQMKELIAEKVQQLASQGSALEFYQLPSNYGAAI